MACGHHPAYASSNASLTAAPSAAGSSATSFCIHYEVDEDEVPTLSAAAQLAAYGGEDEGCWVLLESVASEVDGCMISTKKHNQGRHEAAWEGMHTNKRLAGVTHRARGRTGAADMPHDYPLAEV